MVEYVIWNSGFLCNTIVEEISIISSLTQIYLPVHVLIEKWSVDNIKQFYKHICLNVMLFLKRGTSLCKNVYLLFFFKRATGIQIIKPFC